MVLSHITFSFNTLSIKKEHGNFVYVISWFQPMGVLHVAFLLLTSILMAILTREWYILLHNIIQIHNSVMCGIHNISQNIPHIQNEYENVM
jgi:hypothetical protein